MDRSRSGCSYRTRLKVRNPTPTFSPLSVTKKPSLKSGRMTVPSFLLVSEPSGLRVHSRSREANFCSPSIADQRPVGQSKLASTHRDKQLLPGDLSELPAVSLSFLRLGTGLSISPVPAVPFGLFAGLQFKRLRSEAFGGIFLVLQIQDICPVILRVQACTCRKRYRPEKLSCRSNARERSK